MSSKTDAIVRLAIVFFISLLSFSIGTFVGKKYSDNQHQLASLEPQKGEHGAERGVASDSHDSEHKGAMSDEEIAKLAEEFVADDNKAPEAGHDNHASNESHAASANEGHEKSDTHHNEPTHHATAPAAHESKHEPAAHHDEPSPAAKSIANIKEERHPTSLPKDVANVTVGKFTIQIASYADEGEAQKMASDLKNKGYSAFYVPAEIKGKVWYRVSVGQFATQKEAQSYRVEFLNRSKVESAIIQKIIE